MLEIRLALQQSGADWHFEDRGFGSFSVNTAAGGDVGGFPRDVIFGPFPKVLKWEDLGAGNAARVTWSYEVAMPQCSDARFDFALMDFAYNVTWSFDHGYTTRVISGHLEIPGSRQSPGSKQILDTADSYREKINPAVPPGFYRVPGPFTLDESKTRLSFTITDTEANPNLPPPGCVEWSGSHNVQSCNRGLTQWTSVIRADYEPWKGTPRQQAQQWFMALVADRMAQATKYGKLPQGVKAGGPSVYAALTGLSLGEPEIYGRRACQFAATILLTTTQETAVAASGLWRPAPAPYDNWPAWQKSMMAGPWNIRGQAGMKYGIGEDAIISLCDDTQPVLPKPNANQINAGVIAGAGAVGFAFAGVAAGPGGALGAISTFLANLPQPTAQNSWAHFENEVTIQTINETCQLKPLPQNQGDLPASMIQARAAGTNLARMVGEAFRIGFPIQPPNLESIAGQPAIPANTDQDGFAQKVVANWSGLPVWRGVWIATYIFGQQPAKTPMPPSPLLGQSENDPEIIGKFDPLLAIQNAAIALQNSPWPKLGGK